MLKEVSIEIIRKCPNSCVHCSSMSNLNCQEILPFDRFTTIVEDAVKLGATTICLSGGEPFLHSNIVEMIDYVATKGIDCYVYSSGIMLDDAEKHMSISKDILSSIHNKVTKIIFNIEAATESTYNKVMGTSCCFELMKESVRRAISLSIITEAHFVPMKPNICEIDQVVSLCCELGISKLSFLRLVPHGRAQINETELVLSELEFAELKKKLSQLNESSC